MCYPPLLSELEMDEDWLRVRVHWWEGSHKAPYKGQ